MTVPREFHIRVRTLPTARSSKGQQDFTVECALRNIVRHIIGLQVIEVTEVSLRYGRQKDRSDLMPEQPSSGEDGHDMAVGPS